MVTSAVPISRITMSEMPEVCVFVMVSPPPASAEKATFEPAVKSGIYAAVALDRIDA